VKLELIRLEIGAGKAPKEGYLHNDVHKFEHIEYACEAWQISLPSNSVSEVLAKAVVEHLTRAQVSLLFDKVHEILVPGGIFQFDVPDIRVWCAYLHKLLNGGKTPFTEDHIFATFWGWQRWPGDEHKWGWTKESIRGMLKKSGFTNVQISDGVACIGETNLGDPGNAHLRCVATKGHEDRVRPLFNLATKGAYEFPLLKVIRNLIGFVPPHLWSSFSPYPSALPVWVRTVERTTSTGKGLIQEDSI